jgi:hypothetical protein
MPRIGSSCRAFQWSQTIPDHLEGLFDVAPAVALSVADATDPVVHWMEGWPEKTCCRVAPWNADAGLVQRRRRRKADVGRVITTRG